MENLSLLVSLWKTTRHCNLRRMLLNLTEVITNPHFFAALYSLLISISDFKKYHLLVVAKKTKNKKSFI